jgi:hypothetical protein
MKFNANTLFIDNYLGLLNTLSRENKIKIIAKLSANVANENADDHINIDNYFGAFISEKSAEDIIDEIHKSRNFKRHIESF